MHADTLPREEMLAKEAARLIWNHSANAAKIHDPRTTVFARTFLKELAVGLRDLPPVIRETMDGAARSAETMNVAQFQGVIECVQNADDVQATEVRFALRVDDGVRQLLIVHNGQPVTFHHVLSMALPFLTTKTERHDQRGRFGIGLKTLKRIASAISIHSAPYHFSGDMLSFGLVDPQAALPGFYEPEHDTLIEVNLKTEVKDEDLQAWFDQWGYDGLIFLSSVRCFRRCTVEGETLSERSLRFGAWENVPFDLPNPAIASLQSRQVEANGQAWTVWKATVRVPAHLSPANKARTDTTAVAVAVSDRPGAGSVYIGFKTRIPADLPFSLDAQFDPGTSRETMIENPWNAWLIAQCGEVLGAISIGLLKTHARAAWYLVPVAIESIGGNDDSWLSRHFRRSFGNVRDAVCSVGRIRVGDQLVALDEIAFAHAYIEDLLAPADIRALYPDKHPLPQAVRDCDGRWRSVLEQLDLSVVVSTQDLLRGFSAGIFSSKLPTWWASAGRAIVEDLGEDDETAPFGAPFLLSEDRDAISCVQKGTTARPLILAADISAFAAHWNLYERLHPIYRTGQDAHVVMKWLDAEAAFANTVDATLDLAAFAEKFAGAPLEIDDEHLRQLRDHFDNVAPEKADALGRQVGAVLLLDGHTYTKGTKAQKKKVSPATAYLCKTLDGEHPNWPVAAGSTPGLDWISSRYDEQLKAGTRATRRRSADGVISRGPRKFLMLLGAESAPRLVRTGLMRWGKGTRYNELTRAQANQVAYDVGSADLNRVLEALCETSKKDAKSRAPALLRALSRNWSRLYQQFSTVPSQFMARVHSHDRSPVTAQWLITLRETEWIPVGRGSKLAAPRYTVLKSTETQTMYDSNMFAIGIEANEIEPEMASAMGLITSIRISDVVNHLREMRDSGEPVILDRVVHLYRTISRQVPRSVNYQTLIGDMTVRDLREAFNEGAGLVYTGCWRRATEVMRGKDIFRSPDLFVPAATGLVALWIVLNVRRPTANDCIHFWRQVANGPVNVHATSMLIDICHYLEALFGEVVPERNLKERLRSLPLACGSQWRSKRPIYYVENRELRAELAKKSPTSHFWDPPCDTRELSRLLSLIGITPISPTLEVTDDRGPAMLRGEQMHKRFAKAVECLSDELARNDSATHARMAIGWEQLKNLPLFVYERAVRVSCKDGKIAGAPCMVELQALLLEAATELHLCEEAIERREQGGRAIAMLFPPETRHWIEAEWFAAWHKSREADPEGIRLAADVAEIRKKMQEQADNINAKGKRKGEVKVKAASDKREGALPPRTLKSRVGVISRATIHEGQPPQPGGPAPIHNKGKLKEHEPIPRSRPEGPQPATTAYSIAELEDRGWDLLKHALNDSDDPRLVDFRNRHGVGADGAIDWKTFVELKATGREPQSSIEMSSSEYERALERGADYILALVSGMEDGQRDEVRLIFDPAGQASVRPINGMRLTRLLDAPAVVIHFDESAADAAGVDRE